MKNLVPSGKASIIILALAATAACTPKRHGTTAAGKPFDCTIAVPETVDLGLSVCWGTHLVGQSHWADTAILAFEWAAAEPGGWWDDTFYGCPGRPDSLLTPAPHRDAASALLGHGWRIPTKAEARELYRMCRVEYFAIDGRKYERLTGPNGNSLTLRSCPWWTATRSAYADDMAVLKDGFEMPRRYLYPIVGVRDR